MRDDGGFWQWTGLAGASTVLICSSRIAAIFVDDDDTVAAGEVREWP